MRYVQNKVGFKLSLKRLTNCCVILWGSIYFTDRHINSSILVDAMTTVEDVMRPGWSGRSSAEVYVGCGSQQGREAAQTIQWQTGWASDDQVAVVASSEQQLQPGVARIGAFSLAHFSSRWVIADGSTCCLLTQLALVLQLSPEAGMERESESQDDRGSNRPNRRKQENSALITWNWEQFKNCFMFLFKHALSLLPVTSPFHLKLGVIWPLD